MESQGGAHPPTPRHLGMEGTPPKVEFERASRRPARPRARTPGAGLSTACLGNLTACAVRAISTGQRDAEGLGQVAWPGVHKPSDAMEESGPGPGDDREPGEGL